MDAYHIRQLRKGMKLTQVEFGQLVGVSNVTISSWENNHSTPLSPKRARLRAIKEEHLASVDQSLQWLQDALDARDEHLQIDTEARYRDLWSIWRVKDRYVQGVSLGTIMKRAILSRREILNALDVLPHLPGVEMVDHHISTGAQAEDWIISDMESLASILNELQRQKIEREGVASTVMTKILGHISQGHIKPLELTSLTPMSVPEPPPTHGGVLVVPPLIEWLTEHKAPRALIELIQARDAFGRVKYGQGLMTNDGRDNQEDIIQEIGDAFVYCYKAHLRGEITSHNHTVLTNHLRMLIQLLDESLTSHTTP